MSGEVPVSKTAPAQKLGIARSSLYYKKKLPQKDEELKLRIEKAWETHPAYGHRRLSIHLGVGKDRLLRVMRLYRLQPPLRIRSKPVKPDDLGKEAAPYPNLIKGLCPTAPGVVWAADFTYIPFHAGFLFLATVLDVFTRQIVGWNVLSVHTAALITGAFEDALRR